MVAQKVAFIGAGRIVNDRLAEGVRLSRYGRLAGAYDPNPANLAALYDKFLGMNAYNSQEQLLADPNVSIVAIASPHHLHYEHAEAALQAGKHIWVEKPLAVRYEDACYLAQLAEEKGLGLWVDSMMKNNWLNRRAAELIARGDIGEVLRVETKMEFPYDDFDNFRYKETDEEGGGAAWDVGPHCLYTAMDLVGATGIDNISGRWGKKIDSDAIPHQSLYMMYALNNGVVGTSYTSFATHLAGFEDLAFVVHGTKGRIEGYGTLFQHSTTGQEGNDQHLVVYRAGKGIQKRREIRTPRRGARNIYAIEFDRLAKAVARGEELPIARGAISLVGVIQWAMRSANSGGKLLDTRRYYPEAA